MKDLATYIAEAQEVIDLDGMSNAELKQIAHRLSKLARRQGYDIGDNYFLMAFKHLYGNGEYIDFNDIKFATVKNSYDNGSENNMDDLDVMVVYFKDISNPKNTTVQYYDDNEDAWVDYYEK